MFLSGSGHAKKRDWLFSVSLFVCFSKSIAEDYQMRALFSGAR